MKHILRPVVLAFLLLAGTPLMAQPPNVVLVLTDDQGYGDLACLGNPVVKTPHLDQLYRESVRLTRFHVSPLCTPTRAALMTGRDPGRNGAYRTSAGRTMLRTDERTMADVFAAAGYVTGMVGKWHLGDLAPHRPQDRGFHDSVWHRCGGIGQISDHWGNDYYDDIYERNGVLEEFKGYCTDVWFKEAMRFVDENAEKPFFLYVSTNAPHSPYIVDEQWSAPYRESIAWGKGPEFYGMVTNLDHNLGLLRQHLADRGLAENTLLIFMTDNGTANGAKFKGADSEPVMGYNAGMRGKKGSLYDGGHRVPFFVHWPAAEMVGGRDLDTLSAHIDVLPTLAELCGFELPEGHQPDGRSFAPQLRDPAADPHRTDLVLQFHGGLPFAHGPEPWTDSYILRDDWRLINGEELYDIAADPVQAHNIADQHPAVLASMRALYPPYWQSLKDGFSPVRLDVGNPSNNPIELCCQDWYMPQGNPPWRFSMTAKLPRVTAPWKIDVKTAGRYRLTLRQHPKLAGKPVVAVRAAVEVAGQTLEADVQPGATEVVFEVELPAGPADLTTYLYDDAGEAGGAYFTEIEALP